MSDSLKDKFAEFAPSKPERPLNSSILFPEIRRELQENPQAIGNLRGFFVVTVFRKGERKDEWYLLFQGREAPPVISQTRPTLPTPPTNVVPASAATLPVVLVELEDADLLNFVTGGLTGLKAYSSNRLKILGDLIVAQQLEEVFVKAGGVEKVMMFLKNAGVKGIEPAVGSGKRKKAKL
ncbi:hypothetical protein HK102_006477 [Quaeritorhiza haematococci]|nr:hypothetical protein HK102_006477 [Quaeritorhiza haematococci]